MLVFNVSMVLLCLLWLDVLPLFSVLSYVVAFKLMSIMSTLHLVCLYVMCVITAVKFCVIFQPCFHDIISAKLTKPQTFVVNYFIMQNLLFNSSLKIFTKTVKFNPCLI